MNKIKMLFIAMFFVSCAKQETIEQECKTCMTVTTVTHLNPPYASEDVTDSNSFQACGSDAEKFNGLIYRDTIYNVGEIVQTTYAHTNCY